MPFITQASALAHTNQEMSRKSITIDLQMAKTCYWNDFSWRGPNTPDFCDSLGVRPEPPPSSHYFLTESSHINRYSNERQSACERKERKVNEEESVNLRSVPTQPTMPGTHHHHHSIYHFLIHLWCWPSSSFSFDCTACTGYMAHGPASVWRGSAAGIVKHAHRNVVLYVWWS